MVYAPLFQLKTPLQYVKYGFDPFAPAFQFGCGWRRAEGF